MMELPGEPEADGKPHAVLSVEPRTAASMSRASTESTAGTEEEEGLHKGSRQASGPDEVPAPAVALRELFTKNKINVLLVLIPVALWADAHRWSDDIIFILTFLAMVPLAALLGAFTEELATHTNE